MNRRNLRPISIIPPDVNQLSKADKARARAARLRNEARNCLAIAISMSRSRNSPPHLIDEALRLARRSRELAA